MGNDTWFLVLAIVQVVVILAGGLIAVIFNKAMKEVDEKVDQKVCDERSKVVDEIKSDVKVILKKLNKIEAHQAFTNGLARGRPGEEGQL